MRVWVELSGEHPTLPRAEVLAVLEAEGVRLADPSWSTKVFHATVEGPFRRVAVRLGLAHVVCEELARGDLADLEEAARAVDLHGRPFRIRGRGLVPRADAKAAEKRLGAILGRTGRVDLTRPEMEYRVLLGETSYLGRVVHTVDRAALEARKVTYRPFSLPISLHPKWARALVNLSRTPAGERLLDPFCGTGGILLEASRMGLRGIGGDVRRSMAAGARSTLHRLGAAADFIVADAGRGPWRPGALAGVATDPPYGRAATTRKEKPLDLYDRAFAMIRDVLRPRGTVAIILPSDDAVEIGRLHLELVERHALRVHGSLTRTFCAYVK